MFMRDIEKVARALHAQNLELEYIRHYLMDSYQLGSDQVETVFKRIGLVQSSKLPGKKTVGPDKRSTYY